MVIFAKLLPACGKILPVLYNFAVIKLYATVSLKTINRILFCIKQKRILVCCSKMLSFSAKKSVCKTCNMCIEFIIILSMKYHAFIACKINTN